VYGALVGVKVGRRVEISNSYEVVESEVSGNTVLDLEYLNTKRTEGRRNEERVREWPWFFLSRLPKFSSACLVFTPTHIYPHIHPSTHTHIHTVAKVFPDSWDTFVGWYTTGEDASEADLDVYRQVMHINENPLFLVLNPNPPAGMRELPVSIFEVETHIVDNQPTHFFSPVTYRLETEDSERIAVEHVASSSIAGAEGSSKGE
jgi:hypothetical protein